jgi:hypothetical protein
MPARLSGIGVDVDAKPMFLLLYRYIKLDREATPKTHTGPGRRIGIASGLK